MRTHFTIERGAKESKPSRPAVPKLLSFDAQNNKIT